MARLDYPITEKDRALVSEKISLLMREGKPQKQAVAIALSMWRHGYLTRSNPVKRKKHGGKELRQPIYGWAVVGFYNEGRVDPFTDGVYLHKSSALKQAKKVRDQHMGRGGGGFTNKTFKIGVQAIDIGHFLEELGINTWEFESSHPSYMRK